MPCRQLESRTAVREPLRTDLEIAIAGIWSALLNRTEIGVSDNFFDLGGHSLLATQLVSRLRTQLAVDVPLRTFFERPTVRGLAEAIPELAPDRQSVSQIRHRAPTHVDELQRGPGAGCPRRGAEAEGPAMSARHDSDARGEDARPRDQLVDIIRQGAAVPVTHALSYAQQRLWFLDQLNPANPFYNIHHSLNLDFALDVRVLERALDEIVRRHEALRTPFAPSKAGRCRWSRPNSG